MARVTVEDCLENVANRFELVMLATKRSRQLATGGKEPKVAWENDTPKTTSLKTNRCSRHSRTRPTRPCKSMVGRRRTAQSHKARQEHPPCRV